MAQCATGSTRNPKTWERLTQRIDVLYGRQSPDAELTTIFISITDGRNLAPQPGMRRLGRLPYQVVAFTYTSTTGLPARKRS